MPSWLQGVMAQQGPGAQRTSTDVLNSGSRTCRWVVSEGCTHAEGILVRSAWSLHSEILGRLAPGTKVLELATSRGRLHYQLLEPGSQSPPSGWVSLAANGKELLQLLEPQVLETGTKPSEFLQKKETAADADTVASGKHRNAELRSAPNTPVSEDDQNTQEVFWQVAGTNSEGLLVRTEAALSSALLSSRLAQGAKVKELERTEGGRLRYELIAGDGPKTGWVSLSAKGHDLLRRIGQKTSEPMLNTDYSGVVRGACTNCRDCQLWRFESFSSVEWGGSDTSSTIEDRRQAYDRKMRGYRETRKGQGALCEACQCKAEHHLDLSGWLEAVRQAARPFRQTYEDAIRKDPAYRHLGMAMGTAKPRRLPRHAELPAAALQWPHSEVAMFLLSLGVYDPRYHARDGGGPGGDTVSSVSPPGPGSLISVICPTSQKRHAFHPLLYQNFCSQTYEEKELLVLETGSRPSEFLQKKAKEDSRVVYWHFPVEDSRENDPMSAVILDDGFSVYTGEEVKKRRGLHFKPKAGWSLGFKRNLCCHLARGTVIAHFDDDDLYAPRYLEEMREALLIAERSSAAAARPAAATLAEWHMMDVKDQRFGFFSPRNEPLLEHEQRESFLYGYGFSFVYTKSAWERVPFPDTEWSEDGDFMGRLQLKKIPIQLVSSHTALAAHTHHSDSTSGGELCGNVRLGYGVPTPEEFKELLPIARKVALDSGIRQGAQHPLRAEMHRVLDGLGQAPSEIRWHEKEQFLRNNPDFGRRVATPQYKTWQGPWRGLGGFSPARTGVHFGFAF
ncbi:TPR_REGION domain-containing protein [Durusdinium trenchii]|uniref:TPR_REGION domain-containing protein n=1 Tax=Durusdinium trenchii TaxID=1381693 RepID=A0ABP0SMZ8_9DINO